MLLNIGNYKWDAKTKALTTPSDTANEESLELEQAACYNNNFGMKMNKILAEKAKKKQGQLMNPEDIYKINDSAHTHTTLNKRPGTNDSSPDSVRLDLGQRGQEKDQLVL